MKKRCCIIGSGIGGLSAAVKVAQLGYHVDIYEQSSSIGGKAKKKSIDSYTFDTGPSILTM
ncbi:MAG: NAD(P)-binding protein, partial [Spirochaetota bacterium]|nr:NAD(P)-binding protein [Spirochaetota bacterium]